MSIKDKMKNAKESHLFDELSQEEKIEAIVNGKLKCRMIEELEKIKEEINEFCKGYLNTPQPEYIGEDINKNIIDNHIAELKGE